MLRKFTLNGKHVCNMLSEGSKKTDDNECLGECECVSYVCTEAGGEEEEERENKHGKMLRTAESR